MARWTELLLLALLLSSGGGQQSSPEAMRAAPAGTRAVLLQDAVLYDEPSTTGEVMRRLPAGSLLDYAGETTDAFGRTWYQVRDSGRLVSHREPYLTRLSMTRVRELGYRVALLADRQPVLVPARGAATAGVGGDQAWWRPVATLEPGNAPTFGEVVAVSARAPSEAEVRQAIELLGGMDAIARWPLDPLPGELFVPELLPALFEYDGTSWDLAQPVRLLGDSVTLLGNGTFMVDESAPPLAGGPSFYCWEVANVLDPAGELAGSVAVAPALTSPRRGDPAPVDLGPFDATQAPPRLASLLPPAPDTTRVPPRVDPPADSSGVLLEDTDGQQAVFVRQRLGQALTHRLRGLSLVLDVRARDNPRAGAATFGIHVEVTFADGRRSEHFPRSFTSRATPRRFELAFDVPPDADDILIRLLPLDRSLAVEQQGSVIFDRVGLRAAEWDPSPPASSVVLYRLHALIFEGAPLYTRAAVALTMRDAAEIEEAWQQVAASEWPVEDQQLVLAGELRRGMGIEQVVAAWGRPADRITRADGSELWNWNRDDRYALFDAERVIIFRPPARRDVAQVPLRCPLR